MQVWPKSDDIRKVLKHPTAGAFQAEGPAEWPDDTYTYRRINDGDVTTEDPGVARKREEPRAAAPKKE